MPFYTCDTCGTRYYAIGQQPHCTPADTTEVSTNPPPSTPPAADAATPATTATPQRRPRKNRGKN